jgi:hypothetical protein
MLKKREIIWILMGIFLMTLLLTFQNNTLQLSKALNYFFISFLIITVSILFKKITARKVDVEIEIMLWQFNRWWISRKSYFKKEIPIGILLPLILSFLSTGIIRFLTFFQFEAEALPSKVAKNYGRRRFSTVLEWDYALIAFYSTAGVWLLSIIASYVGHNYNFNFPLLELAKYSFYYTIYNLIPFGGLDGLKLLMGSRPLYIFTLFLLLIVSLFVFL